MNLNDAQQQTVRQWIQDGLKLSDIQKRIASEFDLRMTYMEVRFLMDDLKMTPKDQEPPAKQPLGTLPDRGVAGAAQNPAAGIPEKPVGGGISVSVDHVTRPGAMVSGNVTFTDGHSAEWYLDQHGRLGLAPKTEGYRPSQQDLITFQSELQKELQRAGF